MDFKQKHLVKQIENQKRTLFKGDTEISLTKILGSDRCQGIIANSREFRERVYPPLKTIFMFIKQVLSPDKSCKNIVASAIAEDIVEGKEPASNNTGPYSKARMRLPEDTIMLLLEVMGIDAAQKTLTNWKWRRKEVKSFDGSTLLMPDTQENQEAFPQHGGQQKGVGFPIARIVVIFSLTVGVVLKHAVGAFQGKGNGELSLLRRVFSCIVPNDVLLGDAYFPSYFLMCDLQKVGADGVFRGQGQRNYDFRRGEILGSRDHFVEWRKPIKPDWMDEEQYQMYPHYIKIREFKVNGKVYVTTFLNAKKYHKNELARLYELRWQCEINLRSIKTIMRMEMLSCKTPEMVRKEIGIHLIAYNIIRILIAEACSKHFGVPNHVSFKGTVQLLNQFMPIFLNVRTSNCEIYNTFLRLIVSNEVGNRPGRIEPRAVKRRPKPFPRLHNGRQIEKEKILKKIQRKMLKRSA
jgi:hypothetical protein